MDLTVCAEALCMYGQPIPLAIAWDQRRVVAVRRAGRGIPSDPIDLELGNAVGAAGVGGLRATRSQVDGSAAGNMPRIGQGGAACPNEQR